LASCPRAAHADTKPEAEQPSAKAGAGKGGFLEGLWKRIKRPF
jgi:hypothetical protein